jgi:hypothetical protein
MGRTPNIFFFENLCDYLILVYATGIRKVFNKKKKKKLIKKHKVKKQNILVELN